MKKQKGITLIALVITIIVLLILAGVTIVTLTGDNGLLQKAQNAKEENEKAKELELIKLAVSAAQVAGEGKLNTTNLKNELETNLNDNDIDNNLKSIANFWNYKGYKIDNNGNIEKLLLPEEYQQLQYIKCVDEQYINTCVLPTYNTKLEMEAEATLNKNIAVPYGSSDGTHIGNFEMLFFLRGGKARFDFSNLCQNAYSNDVLEVDKKYLILQDGKNNYINGIQQGTNNTSLTFTGTHTITLFARNNQGTVESFFVGKIFYTKIWNNNKSIRNFIPCYSNTIVTDVDGKQCPKNTIGMYDTVEGKFYTNQGTGEFIAGPEV